MPLYEYQCQRCQRRIEKIQSFSAAPLTTCEACGGPLERLISAPAIQFKGSGWYVTDYAHHSSSPAPAHHEDGGKDAAPAKNGDKTDKPAAASEPAKPAAASSDK